MTIVATHYRYKRPPRKRKAVPLEGPAIVGKRAPPSQQASAPKSTAPANDDRKAAIVTPRRPGARLSVDVPDMGLPWCIGGGLVAYRKSWLAEAGAQEFPKNWDNFRAVGKKLKAAGRPYGQTAGHTFGDAPGWW